MSDERIKEFLKELNHGKEYWKRDTPKTITEVYQRFLEKGLSADDIEYAIECVWGSCSSEYGN